jgi:predicted dehydrogenase
MIFTGSHATAVFDDLRDWPEKLVLHAHPQGADTLQPLGTTPVDLPVVAPLEAELSHFIRCIRTGQAPRSGLAQGREILSFILSLGQDKPSWVAGPSTPAPADQLMCAS